MANFLAVLFAPGERPSTFPHPLVNVYDQSRVAGETSKSTKNPVCPASAGAAPTAHHHALVRRPAIWDSMTLHFFEVTWNSAEGTASSSEPPAIPTVMPCNYPQLPPHFVADDQS